MRKFFISAMIPLLTVPFLLGVGPKPGALAYVDVVVHNDSDTCVWVTVYHGRLWYPWTIAGGSARPGYLKPSEERKFHVPMPNGFPIGHDIEVKVRGEFESSAKCEKPTVADRSNENKHITDQSSTVQSTLSGHKGSYSVSKPD